MAMEIIDEDIGGFHSFPCELKEVIWSHMELKKRLPLRNVCREWNLRIPFSFKTLDLKRNKSVTDKMLSQFSCITSLDLGFNKLINSQGIYPLTNLTDLNLYDNKIITNEGISCFTNLKSLYLFIILLQSTSI